MGPQFILIQTQPNKASRGEQRTRDDGDVACASIILEGERTGVLANVLRRLEMWKLTKIQVFDWLYVPSRLAPLYALTLSQNVFG